MARTLDGAASMWTAISTSWTTMPGNLLATSLVSERGEKYPRCYPWAPRREAFMLNDPGGDGCCGVFWSSAARVRAIDGCAAQPLSDQAKSERIGSEG
jgi:hypothetical protein